MKLQDLWQLYQKQTPTQVFSSEYSEIFKDNFFHRTPMVAASEISCHYKNYPVKILLRILVKEVKNGITIFNQKYIILKEIKNFSYRLQNFIFQSKYFAD